MRNFDEFVKFCLSEIIIENNNRNDGKVYCFSYDDDTITISNCKADEIGLLTELQSVSLTREEYLDGNKSDEDLLKSLLNTIQSTSE